MAACRYENKEVQRVGLVAEDKWSSLGSDVTDILSYFWNCTNSGLPSIRNNKISFGWIVGIWLLF